MARVYKRLFTYLLLSIFSLFLLLFLMHTFSPTDSIPFWQLSIPVIPIFFLLVFTTIFGLFTFIGHAKAQGVLCASVAIFYLFLRMQGVTHLFFLILTLILFGVLELLLLKAK